jgi:hypothetical protein
MAVIIARITKMLFVEATQIKYGKSCILFLVKPVVQVANSGVRCEIG